MSHSFPIRVACLALLALLVTSSAQAAEFGLFGWDVRAGAVIDDGPDASTVGFSLNIAELIPGFYLYPGANYTSGDSGVSFERRDLEADTLSVGIEARYYLAREERGWYFGAGPYYYRSDEDRIGLNLRGQIVVLPAETDTEIAPMFVAGHQFGDGGRGWLLEARITPAGPFDGIRLLGGYSF